MVTRTVYVVIGQTLIGADTGRWGWETIDVTPDWAEAERIRERATAGVYTEARILTVQEVAA